MPAAVPAPVVIVSDDVESDSNVSEFLADPKSQLAALKEQMVVMRRQSEENRQNTEIQGVRIYTMAREPLPEPPLQSLSKLSNPLR